MGKRARWECLGAGKTVRAPKAREILNLLLALGAAAGLPFAWPDCRSARRPPDGGTTNPNVLIFPIEAQGGSIR